MDWHVTRWHQTVSCESFGSGILISCQPLEEKVKSIGSARPRLAYWCKWMLEYRLNGANLNDSCKGISSFVRKSIVRACLIGFEKGSQSKAGAAAVDVPTVS